jgi:dipeptidyl aminopeptidase/acylaminoacyl peptidase
MSDVLGIFRVSMRMRIFITTFATLALSIGAECSEKSSPLQIRDALAVRNIAVESPIGISPDGEWVAYTVQDNRKRETPGTVRYSLYTKTGAFVEAEGCDIWIVNTRTGESKNLTESKGTSWSPVWSPDGKYLAFYSDRNGVANLWLWERSTGKLRLASDATVRPFFNSEVVRWSSDSRRLLFKVLPEKMTLEEAEDLVSGPASTGMQVSANRKTSGVTATVYSFIPEDEKKPEQPSEAAVKHPDDWMNRYLSDLATLDLQTGKLNRMIRRRRPLGYWFSPDARYIAYTHFKNVEPNSQQIVYEFSVVSLSDAREHVLVPNLRQEDGGSVSWSPDSTQLAFLTSGPKAQPDCYVVKLDGSDPRNLTNGKYPSFGDPNGGENRPPQWDFEGQNLYLISASQYRQAGSNKIWQVNVASGRVSEIASIPNSNLLKIIGPVSGGRTWIHERSLTVVARDNTAGQIAFESIDLQNSKATELFHAPISLRGSTVTTDVTHAGTIAFVAEDAAHPQDIWILDEKYRTPKRITTTNPQLERTTMGKSRTIEWRSLDGVQLHGALLLPGNYEEGVRYPLIVDVYGGATLSDVVNRFGFGGVGAENMQILATRGYVVLFPDSPLAQGTPLQDLLKTVMPGVNRVIDLGVADPDRLGLMGHSYGGYSTLALLVQTKAFAAAVDSAGVSDLVSDYGSMSTTGEAFGIGWVESGQGGIPGTPWQYRSTFIENSPLFYLDRVQTPLLLVHGALDEAVPPSQTEAVFVGLRRLGKEVVYVKYAGEGHWEGEWGPDNVVDYWQRVITWFDSHLQVRANK